MLTLSFTSANFVARARNYSGEDNWGIHEPRRSKLRARKVSTRSQKKSPAPVSTRSMSGSGTVIGSITMTKSCAMCRRRGARHNLHITSYAGGLTATTFQDMQRPMEFTKKLGPIKAGGLWGSLSDADATAAAEQACAENNVRWGFENHPEKTFDEILLRMGGGKHKHIGVASTPAGAPRKNSIRWKH